MKKIFFFVKTVLFIMIILSCNKFDLPKNTPSCIKRNIKKNDCIEKVLQYEYNSKKVYVILFGRNCVFLDTPSPEYYNEDCELILTKKEELDEFIKNSTKKTIIWELH